MAWNREQYRAAMRDLDHEIRRNAIELANLLLQDGHDEDFAVRLAIVRAMAWGRLHALLSSVKKSMAAD